MRWPVLTPTLILASVLSLSPTPATAQAQTAARMPIVADNIVVQRDVIYGRPDGAAVLADVAYPDMGKNLPVMLFVHGGRWVGGERLGRLQLYVEDWAKAGFFAMTIDYRLAGTSPQPAGYQDLMCAIRWVHAHAEQYGIDPSRIYLSGNSSGGHVVSLAATLGNGPYDKVGGWKDASSDIKAVVSIAGAYDLNTLSWGNLWTPLNAPDVKKAREIASPIHNITPATKPILIVHSDDDQSVPVQQAVDMAAALAKAGVKHKFVHYKDRGHMRMTDEVITEALAFINDLEGKKPATPSAGGGGR
jgi:acetyl esterase/lipase